MCRFIRDEVNKLPFSFGFVKQTSANALEGTLIGPPAAVAEFIECLIQSSDSEWFSLRSMTVGPVDHANSRRKRACLVQKSSGVRNPDHDSGGSTDADGRRSASASSSASNSNHVYWADAMDADALREALEPTEFGPLAYGAESPGLAGRTGFEARTFRTKDLLHLLPEHTPTHVAEKLRSFLKSGP